MPYILDKENIKSFKMSLAIVIPYYKKTFFRETMESIVSQTCKDFILYIGDDASPEDPLDIIEKCKDKISIVYHRFEENLGGKNLVAQWERCIDLTNGEEWLWLFSDDDVMQNTCVEEFKKTIIQNECIQFIRFSKRFSNVRTGEGYNTIYEKGKTSFTDFVMDALDLTQNHVTMPEFVYKRNLYERNGYVNFPLAWWSDKATYLNYILDAESVYNLSSVVTFKFGENISSDNSEGVVMVKDGADIMFLSFMKRYVEKVNDAKHQNMNDVWQKFIDRMTYVLCKNTFLYRNSAVVKMLPYAKGFSSYKNLFKILFNKKK